MPRICVAPVRSAVIGIRIGIRLGIGRSLLRHRLVYAVRSRGNHLRSVLHGRNIGAFAIEEFLGSVNRLGKRVTCRLVRDLACRTVKQRLCVSNGLLQCGSRLIHFQSSLAGVHSCGCCGNGLGLFFDIADLLAHATGVRTQCGFGQQHRASADRLEVLRLGHGLSELVDCGGIRHLVCRSALQTSCLFDGVLQFFVGFGVFGFRLLTYHHCRTLFFRIDTIAYHDDAGDSNRHCRNRSDNGNNLPLVRRWLFRRDRNGFQRIMFRIFRGQLL